MSPYALTKLVAEHYCQLFLDLYGLRSVCLRYFNIYGPRQDPKSEYAAVIPGFISLVKGNKSPVIFGDGDQKRDFTFVRDCVQANILAAEGDASGVYNVGTGHNTTVNELADIIIRELGRDISPEHREPRTGDVRDSLADITRARTFGYEPRYSLAEGLGETIRSFENS
jgi:UDP-glucose 4-epimerase